MNLANTLVVMDEAGTVVVTITLCNRTKEDIANAIASLEAVYLFCTVEILKDK